MPFDHSLRTPGAREAAISPAPIPQYPLSAVISAGRSGSSWLGSLISSSPEVAYRFEPFHRQGPHTAETDKFLGSARGGQATSADVATLYEAFRPRNLAVERPPFFHQPWQRRFQHQIWAASRAIPQGQRLYGFLSATPPPGTHVVFKDVTLEALIGVFLDTLEIPVVYLVRNPCAAVLSDWRGQESGVMTRGRQEILRNYLEHHKAYALLDEVADQLDSFDSIQRTAVLWRCDTELAMSALAASGTGCTVIYEELCDNTEAEMTRIFSYLGLPFEPETARFIAQLDGFSSDATKHSDARDPYFSVQRNPHIQRDRWQADITARQRAQIEAIVEPSPAFQALAAVAPWT